jgi:DNA-3-methyladenine glycosylase
MILKQNFYTRDTEQVALECLGKVLVHKDKRGTLHRGRIVEVEAYLGVKDAAAHSFGERRTQRTEVMYLEGGHAYVYLIYGMYNCLNFVTQEADRPEAILIRALEPVPLPKEKVSKNHLHTNGPGKLCRYFDITKDQNGAKLWKKNSGLWVEDDDYKVKPPQIVKAPRIGVDYAGDAALWPLRFYLKDSPWVSKK